MKKRPHTTNVTSAWEIRGFSRAGGALRIIKSAHQEPRLGVEVSEFVSEIWGGHVWEGNRPLFPFTLEVGIGEDPRAHDIYRRVEALCTFGAAVQNIVAGEPRRSTR